MRHAYLFWRNNLSRLDRGLSRVHEVSPGVVMERPALAAGPSELVFGKLKSTPDCAECKTLILLRSTRLPPFSDFVTNLLGTMTWPVPVNYRKYRRPFHFCNMASRLQAASFSGLYSHRAYPRSHPGSQKLNSAGTCKRSACGSPG